ncbi:MAG TPA: SDR family NAD(P)-dependent oxidoreductase [Ferruginibacter sp.]|nr:SDR family NAD(P)-dependent oxidoreductase [Ferruginibacter sp.]HRO17724.1 SDR family NAD(P)-dependent oxidoreductase [Ferruginibacter sp.]HRQ20572.1 SDR family NAD(P)-dependent oxidoreductase [Ferruginibacter sp.]
MIKNVFITGATSGIGAACAELYASHGHNLLLTGRRADKLEAIQKSLEDTYRVRVTVYCFDVRDRQAADAVAVQLKENNTSVDILINNAGLALGRHTFDDADMNDWEVMIDTNVKGVLYVTRALLPLMKPGSAHIINIGSVAGKEVYEKGNVYCATKFALDALSQSMRIDLLSKNIKVTAIHPGAVQTEFSLVRFKGDAKTAEAVYDGFTPLQAADVANTVYFCTSLPENVCINDLVITCTAQANAIYFNKQQ